MHHTQPAKELPLQVGTPAMEAELTTGLWEYASVLFERTRFSYSV
jgi:hypothetical protein